ncbi:MAG: hypothetical protein EOO38_24000 [Cytophagaceae bacterium]|nr:MAG: hypothetical protein EOO38_24000 [Cytophagaceae bacterium]
MAPAASGNLKSLHANYKAERSDYKSNKLAGVKINPIGGSFVHESQGADTSGLPDSVKKILAKDMAQMTADDFRTIGKAFHIDDIFQAQTKYMNKSERLDFLIQVKNGIFCDKDGNPCTQDMIYAMDKYGMLYGKPVIGLTQDVETAFFNHSSFMSGKDVICAGEITFNLTQWHLNKLDISDTRLLGKTLIDTASGHYQPDGVNLKNCVLSLVHSGLNPNMHVAGSPHSSPSLPYQLAADLIR